MESLDGRMSAVELAQQVSASINTVRRWMAVLEAGGWLQFRCDVTRAVTRHAIAATIWLSVPPAMLRGSARSIARMLDKRAVFYVAGPQNLVVMVWLRHPADLPDFEVRLTVQAPAAVIADRMVALRTVKHIGRLLDEQGRMGPVVQWHSSRRASEKSSAH